MHGMNEQILNFWIKTVILVKPVNWAFGYSKKFKNPKWIKDKQKSKKNKFWINDTAENKKKKKISKKWAKFH